MRQGFSVLTLPMKTAPRSALLLAAGLGAMVLGLAPAVADTLQDALALAYRTNPSLTGARAGLRALDEGVPQAKALGRPTLSVSAGIANARNDQSFQDHNTNALTVTPQVNLPIFQGGLVGASVKGAERRIEAGRANLRSTEAQTFVDVVSAYLEVIRAQRVVDLNDNQVKVLGTNVQAAKDRFEVGDVTRTDVAQSEARLAGARSALVSAQGALTVAQEQYRRIVGKFPDSLAEPAPLPMLPQSPDTAVDLALGDNPDLLAAKSDEQAAAADVGAARARQFPTLSAGVSGTYSDFMGTNNPPLGAFGINTDQRQLSGQAGLTVNVPLYQGGAVASRVRQAQATRSQAMERVVLTERAVVNQARAAYANLVAARAVKQSSESAVSANRLALEGVRAENSVGTRDVLDVLNAEQELLNSEVTLVTAQRDEYVAGFALLAAIGHAEARDLGLDGGSLYDPTANYRRVRNRISDWSTGKTPQTQATRTAGPAVP